MQNIDELERFCNEYGWAGHIYIFPLRELGGGAYYTVDLARLHYDLALLYGAGRKWLRGLYFKVEGRGYSLTEALTEAHTRAKTTVPEFALDDLDVVRINYGGSWADGPAPSPESPAAKAAAKKYHDDGLPHLVETSDGKIYAKYRGRYSELK